jgi:hypothetical protein
MLPLAPTSHLIYISKKNYFTLKLMYNTITNIINYVFGLAADIIDFERIEFDIIDFDKSEFNVN